METILFLAKGYLRNSASILTYGTQNSNNSSLWNLMLNGKNQDTIGMEEKLWTFGWTWSFQEEMQNCLLNLKCEV